MATVQNALRFPSAQDRFGRRAHIIGSRIGRWRAVVDAIAEFEALSRDSVLSSPKVDEVGNLDLLHDCCGKRILERGPSTYSPPYLAELSAPITCSLCGGSGLLSCQCPRPRAKNDSGTPRPDLSRCGRPPHFLVHHSTPRDNS